MWQTSEVAPFLSKAADDPEHAEAHLAAAAEVARAAARQKMVVLDHQIGASISVKDERASMQLYDETDPVRAMRRRAGTDAETLRLKAYDPFLWLEDQRAKLREETLRKRGMRSNADLDVEIARQRDVAQAEERKQQMKHEVVHAFQWKAKPPEAAPAPASVVACEAPAPPPALKMSHLMMLRALHRLALGGDDHTLARDFSQWSFFVRSFVVARRKLSIARFLVKAVDNCNLPQEESDRIKTSLRDLSRAKTPLPKSSRASKPELEPRQWEVTYAWTRTRLGAWGSHLSNSGASPELHDYYRQGVPRILEAPPPAPAPVFVEPEPEPVAEPEPVEPEAVIPDITPGVVYHGSHLLIAAGAPTMHRRPKRPFGKNVARRAFLAVDAARAADAACAAHAHLVFLDAEAERQVLAEEEAAAQPLIMEDAAPAPSPYDPAKHLISEAYGNRPPTTEQLEKERISFLEEVARLRGESWPQEEIPSENEEEQEPPGPTVHCHECGDDGDFQTLVEAAAERRKAMIAASFRRPATEEGGVRARGGWRPTQGLAEQHHAYERERARTAGAPYRAAAEQLLLEKKFGLEHAGNDVLENGMRGTASRPSSVDLALPHIDGLADEDEFDGPSLAFEALETPRTRAARTAYEERLRTGADPAVMALSGVKPLASFQSAPALLAREAVLQGTTKPDRDALRRRAALLARQEVKGAQSLLPMDTASRDVVDALEALPEEQRDKAWAGALGATDATDADAYAELELCERQAVERRPKTPVLEAAPWRPDPYWSQKVGPPATDAAHAFRSSKNRPAALRVGKPPPRGAPPPSPVRRLKVEERAASPVTFREEFVAKETPRTKEQNIESALAAQLGQLVGALRREDDEAEQREAYAREQAFLPPIAPKKTIQLAPYKELLPPATEAQARSALDTNDVLEHRPYPLNWSNLVAKPRTKSRFAGEEQRSVTVQSSRSEANTSLVKNREERERREAARTRAQRQARLRTSRARAAEAKARRRKREGAPPEAQDAPVPAPLPALTPVFDDEGEAPAPAAEARASRSSTVVSSFDTDADYSDLESLATASRPASRQSFGSFVSLAERAEEEASAPAPAAPESPTAVEAAAATSLVSPSVASPAAVAAAPAPAAPDLAEEASYVAATSAAPGRLALEAPPPPGGVEESKAEDEYSYSTLNTAGDESSYSTLAKPTVDAKRRRLKRADSSSSMGSSVSATPSVRLKRAHTYDGPSAPKMSRAEQKRAEKEAKLKEKAEREERTRQPVVAVRPRDDSATAASKAPPRLTKKERAVLRRTRRALGEEEEQAPKEYGVVDLGAINNRLRVESSKIQRMRRFTAEWEGDLEDFDSDSD